jgi:adenylyltransferase/sulfurtransferase
VTDDLPPPPDRYARQRQFAPIGARGQQQIQQSRVAVVGCGALGSVAAELLCRAGVGEIRIIDRDIVEWSNLQRQSLFDSRDAEQGAAKAESACRRLTEINDTVKLVPKVIDVTPANIRDLLEDVELAIDATDNFGIRFLINDWAISEKKVWVHGGCVGASGQVRLFDGASRPCFRCLVPDMPPAGAVQTCDTAGVIGSATSAVASLQVTEALKWLSGNRDAVCSDVLALDFWNNRFRQIQLDESLSPNCPACVQRRFEFLDGDQLASSEGTLCGRNAVQIHPVKPNQRLDLQSIAERWQALGPVRATRFFVRLELDKERELTLFRDGRAIIQGTDDVAVARSILDRYVG